MNCLIHLVSAIVFSLLIRDTCKCSADDGPEAPVCPTPISDSKADKYLPNFFIASQISDGLSAELSNLIIDANITNIKQMVVNYNSVPGQPNRLILIVLDYKYAVYYFSALIDSAGNPAEDCANLIPETAYVIYNGSNTPEKLDVYKSKIVAVQIANFNGIYFVLKIFDQYRIAVNFLNILNSKNQSDLDALETGIENYGINTQYFIHLFLNIKEEIEVIFKLLVYFQIFLYVYSPLENLILFVRIYANLFLSAAINFGSNFEQYFETLVGEKDFLGCN